MDFEKTMTRRCAIRRIGATAAGVIAASSGLFSLSNLTSCAPKPKRVVLYFTATGNSLYVARQLAGKDGELLSIPQLVNEGRYDISADEIGIVYPIYGHQPPNMVLNFIRKAKLDAPYRFAVLTYGNRKCNAAEIWDEISRKSGNTFDYISTIVMVDNWLPNFDMNEQIKIDKHIPGNLKRISDDINARKSFHEPVTAEEREQQRAFLAFSGLDPDKGFLMRSERYFETSESCIGCGVCVNVCPRGNWKLDADGPKTHGDCDFCFACIQNCPQKAIVFTKNENDPLLSKGEVNPGARYRNENVSLMDIKLSNNIKKEV